jgi:hypothetical protein
MTTLSSTVTTPFEKPSCWILVTAQEPMIDGGVVVDLLQLASHMQPASASRRISELLFGMSKYFNVI